MRVIEKPVGEEVVFISEAQGAYFIGVDG